MNAMPLLVYAALTLFSRRFYRSRAAAAGTKAVPVFAESDSRSESENLADAVSTRLTESICEKTWYRLLFNLLPTAILILTPAAEYALVYSASAPQFDAYRLIAAFFGAGLHLTATFSSARAVYVLATAEAGQLVTTGEFARRRHPMALAMIIQGLGAGLLLGMQNGWPLWAIGAGLLVVACRLEDQQLRQQFPEAWAVWSSKVNAFFG